MRSLIDRLVEQRDKHVLLHAEPHLNEGEQVIEWVRTEHPTERWRGYAFVTPSHLLVVWKGKGHRRFPWRTLNAWGVSTASRRGCAVGTEAGGEVVIFHIPVGSRATGRRVTNFLREVAERARHCRRGLGHRGHAAFDADPHMGVSPQRRSVTAQMKRAVVTVVGLIGVIGGILITPIPGPWSLPIVIGGLVLLASEHDWAQDVLDSVREWSRQTRERLRTRRAAREE